MKLNNTWSNYSSRLGDPIRLHGFESDDNIVNIQLKNSKSNVLIQLADMVAGAIHRKYESEKSDAKIYYQAIRKRVEDLWEFR